MIGKKMEETEAALELPRAKRPPLPTRYVRNDYGCEVKLIDEEKVKAVDKLVPSGLDAIHVADTFDLFSHPSRVMILAIIAYAGEITSTDVAAILGISPSGIAWHLKFMDECGAIARHTRGGRLFLSMPDERIRKIVLTSIELIRARNKAGYYDGKRQGGRTHKEEK